MGRHKSRKQRRELERENRRKENKNQERACRDCEDPTRRAEKAVAGPSTRSLSPDKRNVAPSNNRLIRITVCGKHGTWDSLFKLEILGVQFEAVLSKASDGSILSSRVYDLIKDKSTKRDKRYELRKVIDGTRICDGLGNELNLLGKLNVPCTIFDATNRTKKVTRNIAFFVIEGGAIDGVVGAPEFSDSVWNMVMPNLGGPGRLPIIVGTDLAPIECPTPDGMMLTVAGIVPKKPGELGSIFKDINRVDYDVILRATYTKKQLVSERPSVQSKEVALESPPTRRELKAGPSTAPAEPVLDSNRPTALGSDGDADAKTEMVPFVNESASRVESRNEGENSTEERCTFPKKIITVVPMSSGEFPSAVKVNVLGVHFEAVLSAGVDGTVLSSRIYNKIALQFQDSSDCELENAEGVEVFDSAGNQMEVLGALFVPCKFISARGSNSTIEFISFLVVDGAPADCILGAPEIIFCQISIILYRSLLVFNKHQPAIPIAMVGAKEDPNTVFKGIESFGYPLIERYPLRPVRKVLITLATTIDKKFPYTLKMEIVGVHFRVALSTGSSGTILSARVFNKIVEKTSDYRYRVQEVRDVEIYDLRGNPITLLGLLHVPCKFISAREKNISVVEMIPFLVVLGGPIDGVFGAPEISDRNITMRVGQGNSVMVFQNYDPPIEIGIVEALDEKNYYNEELCP